MCTTVMFVGSAMPAACPGMLERDHTGTVKEDREVDLGMEQVPKNDEKGKR